MLSQKSPQRNHPPRNNSIYPRDSESRYAGKFPALLSVDLNKMFVRTTLVRGCYSAMRPERNFQDVATHR